VGNNAHIEYTEKESWTQNNKYIKTDKEKRQTFGFPPLDATPLLFDGIYSPG
jgi:hypothetical protein